LRIIYLKNDKKVWNKELLYFDFYASVKACHELGFELWDIQDGEPEWDAVIDYSKQYHLDKIVNGFWINGKAVEKCKIGVMECTKNASNGNGLYIEWPTPHQNNFSRTYYLNNVKENCIYYSYNSKYNHLNLWEISNCSYFIPLIICVKRDL